MFKLDLNHSWILSSWEWRNAISTEGDCSLCMVHPPFLHLWMPNIMPWGNCWCQSCYLTATLAYICCLRLPRVRFFFRWSQHPGFPLGDSSLLLSALIFQVGLHSWWKRWNLGAWHIRVLNLHGYSDSSRWGNMTQAQPISVTSPFSSLSN